MAPGALAPLALGGLFARHLTIVSRPVDPQLASEQPLDLGREHMFAMVRRSRVVPRLAVITPFPLGFVGLVELVDGLRCHASVNREVGLDRLVHADQKLVSLVAHPRDGDLQVAGFVDPPIADRPRPSLWLILRDRNMISR